MIEPRTILFLQGTTNSGGSKYSLLAMIEALRGSRFKPLVVCREPGWLTERLDARGVEWLLLPFYSWRKWLERFRVRPSIRNHWLPALAPHQPALIHSNEFWSAAHGVHLGAALKLPTIVHLRDGHHTLDKARQYHLDRATVVLAVSSALRDQFASDALLHQKTRVMYNAHADFGAAAAGKRGEARKQWGIGEGEVVIGNAGRLCDRKNQMLLLRALALLKERPGIPPIRVLFAGDGDVGYAAALKAELAQRDHAPQVMFLGAVEDMASFYGAVDLMAHCARREGLSRVLPEAMLAGRAVITTDVEGAHDAFPDEDIGRIVPQDDAGKLSQEIEALARDARLRSAIAEKAGQRARRLFNAEAHRAGLLTLYESLLLAPTCSQE